MLKLTDELYLFDTRKCADFDKTNHWFRIGYGFFKWHYRVFSFVLARRIK